MQTFDLSSVTFMHMPSLYPYHYAFQTIILKTVGGVAEQELYHKVGWLDGQRDTWTYIHMTEGKTICPPPLCGRGIKKKKIHNTFNSFPFIILMSNVRTFLHRPNCQNCWPCHVQWLVCLKTLNLWSRHKFHIPIYKELFSIKIKAEIYMYIPLHSLFYIIWRCFIILQILWTYPGSFNLRSSPTYLHKAVGNGYKGIHSHLSLVFFLFFPENRLWYFMHIVIQG